MSAHFLLMGAPGAGKGLFTSALQNMGNFEHLCIGDMLRKEIEDETQSGKLFKQYVESGELVPTEQLFNLFAHKFSHALQGNKRIIVDGIVQSQENVDFIKALLREHGVENNFKFISIRVGREVAEKRLLERFICTRCNTSSQISSRTVCQLCRQPLMKRMDDKNSTIAKRINRFFTSTISLIDQFKGLPQFYEFDGEKEIVSLQRDYQELYGL